MKRRWSLYAAPRGSSYHADVLCTGLNAYYASTGGGYADHNMAPTVSDHEASRRRLTPCRLCRPRPLLTIVR